MDKTIKLTCPLCNNREMVVKEQLEIKYNDNNEKDCIEGVIECPECHKQYEVYGN